MRTSDNERVLTISAGANAYGAAFSPDGAYMYVPHSSSAAIQKVDTATGTVVDTASVGNGTRWVAAGGAFVVSTNYDAGTATIIDAASFDPIATVASGGTPAGVIVDPAGAKAYVAAERSNAVFVFDLATQTLERTVSVGTRTWEMALNPAGTRLYVGTYQFAGLKTIELGTWTVGSISTATCNSLAVASVQASATRYQYLNRPTALAATMADNSAALTWTAPAESGSPVETYRIEWSDNGFVTASSATSQVGAHSVTGLTPGTAYEFRVRAENATRSIESGWSTTLSASTNNDHGTNNV